MSQDLVTLVTNSMRQSSKSFLGPRMPSKTIMILSVNQPSTISASSDTLTWNKGRDCMAWPRSASPLIQCAWERITGTYPQMEARDAAGNNKGRC